MLSLRVMLKIQKGHIVGTQSLRITTSIGLSSSYRSSDNNSKLNKSTITKKQEKPKSGESGNVNVENVLNKVMNVTPSKQKINYAVNTKVSNVTENKHQTFEKKLSEAAEKVGQHYRIRGPSIAKELQKNYIMAQQKMQLAQKKLKNTKKETERQQPVWQNTQQFKNEYGISQPKPSPKYVPHRLEGIAESTKPKEMSHVHTLLKNYMRKSKQTYPPIQLEKETYPENQVVNIYKSLYNETSKHTPLFQYTEQPPAVIQLKTWDMLEKDTLKQAISLGPSNIFEEMIQWTLQGKLWRFPIDNEQGLEKEQNIHFSEHVFMDRHLQGWCPNKGPIRHFMELVCVGLSKNPYMTVEEKVEHIMWYKNYFAEKESLLDLGLAESPSDEAKVEP